MSVSILVLVDLALELQDSPLTDRQPNVSILVLVDLALEYVFTGVALAGVLYVSILVLVDLALE